MTKTGLVLPGGGARNAYQVGVLSAIAEWLPENAHNPFPIICGTSAGAINAAMLASYANDPKLGIERLAGIWRHLHPSKVFRIDVRSGMMDGTRWLLALASGGWISKAPRALLDNSPLQTLLESHIRTIRITQAIDQGNLQALGIITCGYHSGHSICHYQASSEQKPWQRSRRMGRATELSIAHIMASIALPVVFPAVHLDNEYHGDGSIRETAPLSPPLHLGADRLLVITVRSPVPEPMPLANIETNYPSLGHIAGYVLDTLFRDNYLADCERLERINRLLSFGDSSKKIDPNTDHAFKPVRLLTIAPSRDVAAIAPRHIGHIPRSVRFLLRALGGDSSQNNAALLTYLLFEAHFCGELLELGYDDAQQQRSKLIDYLEI